VKRAGRLAAASAFEAALAVVTRDQVPADMRSAGRRPSNAISRARQTSIYLAIVSFDVEQNAIARALGLDPMAVNRALRRVEDRRDDARFDRSLNRLEQELAAC